MIPGPITSTSFPHDGAESAFVIETYDSLRYTDTVDRNPVSALMNEDAAFELELARVRKERMRAGADWEPITVRLLDGETTKRKEIVA